MHAEPRHTTSPNQRINIWYGILIFILALFVVRAFYLQVIRHQYYKTAALSKQLKQYEIPASRGVIKAHDGDTTASLVLNETKYTLFVDPKFIKDVPKTAIAIQGVIGGTASEYEKKMKADSRFVILAKKLNKDKSSQIEKLNLKGVGLREIPVRTYPQNTLASQILGFVNDEGEGKYGLEQALDKDLKGTAGELKAITDAQGVPLAANKDNLVAEPKPGKDITLTLDVGIQQQVEEILKQGLETARSKSGSAVVLDPNTGAIKAMANLPTYNPADFYKIEDASLFTNPAVSSPLEVGSVMKPLTAAAAIDSGAVSRNSSYYDPSRFKIDDATITNIEEDGGAGTRNVADILQLSLNTGATWLLMQMGGGSINEKARTTWYDYMTKHYGFGKQTGIEQGYEATGSIPDPVNGFGLNIQYANTAFGQGMTATPLQMAAALGGVVNGGTYYKPHLIDKTTDENGAEKKVSPIIVRKDVVKPQTGKDIKELMEYVIQKNHVLYGLANLRPEFSIGGKTGTAEVPKPGGGYYEDRFNGMFTGFVGGDKPQYIIVVRVNEPKIAGYAGAKAAAPIFVKIANMLIDNYGVTPRGSTP